MASKSSQSNSTTKDGHQKSIFSTLMRSMSSSSLNMNSHHHNANANRNHDIMLKTNSSSASISHTNTPMSPLAGSTTPTSVNVSSTHLNNAQPSHHHHLLKQSKNSKKKYHDINEDWSAVVDDYNMPIKNDNFLIDEVRNSTQLSRNNSHVNLFKTVSSTPSISSSSSSVNVKPANKKLNKEESVNCDLEFANEKKLQELSVKLSKISKFDDLLNANIINLSELRKLSWSGIATVHRPLVWKLLIGYLPANKRRHDMLLRRKRNEYKLGIDHIFSAKHQRDQATWHQIKIDIPRTNPHIKLYQYPSVQDSLQKILYYWAIRHPASGYVQGINDLLTPFYQSFLTEYLPEKDVNNVESIDPATYLSEEQFLQLESDSFWCMTKFLDTIIDNYIHGQPGILKQVSNLESLCKRIDGDLYGHLQKENVQFLQFAFRWMNCLLMRELPMQIVIRMWDTYLAETSSDEDIEDDMESLSMSSPTSTITSNAGFNTGTRVVSAASATRNGSTVTSENSNNNNSTLTSTSKKTGLSAGTNPNNSASNNISKRRSSLSEFHVFVCAAFLEKWANVLLQMDFQGIITFLQSVPTTTWSESDIEILLSEAYMWQTLYKDATSHWL